MVRFLCTKCVRSFATVGKLCRLHRDITIGQTAALGRYLNPSEQESPKEYGASSGSINPLLPNDEHIAEPYAQDIKRSVADDQKCYRQSEYTSPSAYLESSINVNKLGDSAEKSSSKLIPPKKRKYSCYRHCKSNDVLKKATFDQKAHSSVKSRRKYMTKRKCKKKIYEKKLQKCGKRNLAGSISNQPECSLPSTNLKSSSHVTTLEDSDNPSKLTKRESITSSVDSLAAPGPSGVTKKTKTSKISDKTLHSKFSLKDQSGGAEDKSKSTRKKCKSNNPSKLTNRESITSSVPGLSGVSKKTKTSKISAKTLHSKFSLKDQSGGAADKSKSTRKKCKNNNPSKLTNRESITFSVPGLSGVTKKTKTSKISAKTLHSKFSLKDQSGGAEDKSKSTCKKCKREICDHAYEIEGRYLFKCCACNYRNANKNNLRIHAYYNCCLKIDRLACNICDELIWDRERHGNEETCGFCGWKFRCMTQLEKHALDHESFYKSFCRVCKNKISEHINPQKKTLYKCCKSDYNGSRYLLVNHLYKHKDLQLFKCDLCDKRYQQRPPLMKHLQLHFKCEKCPKAFINENRLKAHEKKYHN